MRLLHLSAGQVQRIRPLRLRQMLQGYEEQEDFEKKSTTPPQSPEANLMPTPRPRRPRAPEVSLPTPRPRRVVAQGVLDVLAPSELAVAPSVLLTGTRSGGGGSTWTRQVSEEAGRSDMELNGLEYLTLPLNVNTICQQVKGLPRLSQHVHEVLGFVSSLETSSRTKRQAAQLHKHVWDTDELEFVTQSLQGDAKQLSTVTTWIRAVVNDLEQLILMRMEAQGSLRAIQQSNTVNLCDKLQRKTLQMQTLCSVMKSRLECVEVVDTPTPPPSSS